MDINVLKCIECHHLPSILRPFKYSTLIKFERNLRIWRESIGAPLLLYSQSHFEAIQNWASPSQSLAISQSSLTSTPTTSRTGSPTITVTLATILANNANGTALAESYAVYNSFNEKQRWQLITVIAQYFDTNKVHLDLATTYRLEKEIVERFPTEKIVKFFISNMISFHFFIHNSFHVS